MKKLIYNFKSKDVKKLKNPKNILGGKGANLAEMGRLGLPVPHGFTISTEACHLFYKNKKKLNSKIIKEINKELGQNVVGIYKRSFSILNSEINKNKLELSNSVDTGLFNNDFEKNLYKKIQEIKKYFLNVGKNDDFEQSLKELFKFKEEVNLFFDNVIVNDENQLIKKNRLELLNLLCKSFDNFFNFSTIEG